MLVYTETAINFFILLCLIHQINILKNITVSLDALILRLETRKKDPEKDIHGDLNQRLLGIQQNRFSKVFRNYSNEE